MWAIGAPMAMPGVDGSCLSLKFISHADLVANDPQIVRTIMRKEAQRCYEAMKKDALRLPK